MAHAKPGLPKRAEVMLGAVPVRRARQAPLRKNRLRFPGIRSGALFTCRIFERTQRLTTRYGDERSENFRVHGGGNKVH